MNSKRSFTEYVSNKTMHALKMLAMLQFLNKIQDSWSSVIKSLISSCRIDFMQSLLEASCFLFLDRTDDCLLALNKEMLTSCLSNVEISSCHRQSAVDRCGVHCVTIFRRENEKDKRSDISLCLHHNFDNDK